MRPALERFYETTHPILDLLLAQQALEWDQEVMMPRKGAEQRARQLSALAAVIHGKLADPALGDLLSELEASGDLEATEAADVREIRRAHDRAVKLPSRLVTERAEACALAQVAWEAARPASDFASFRPHLERVMTLTREQGQILGKGSAYDALLEDYEPGMSEARLRVIFADLKARLLPILDAVRGAERKPDPAILKRHYPQEAQKAFCLRIVRDMGFDLEAGRLDVSAHPFSTGTLRDVRLTTRYLEDFLPSALFGAMHEAGHGLYEQGLDPSRYRNFAGQACSMGIHESQSRLWENFIGRSRAFWSHYFRPLQAAFPESLADVNPEAFYGAVNAVAPSLIRVEADEATYNLHILLRFDLESGLLAGRIEVKDLPELWNEKMQEYLGIAPKEHRDGVLQDIHWAAGLIGYFPSYALGNLFAAQFIERLREEMPDLDQCLARGELTPVKQWLNRNIHVHGRRWLAPDLCERVTGKPLSAEPLERHLKNKLAEVYGF